MGFVVTVSPIFFTCEAIETRFAEQCSWISEPIDSGLFKPKSITHAPRDASLEPREKHFVQIDFSTERNECWEYCSQLPWCQSVHIRMTGECLFYDREETTLETDTLLTDQIILSKKVFGEYQGL